jgi:hypothetical protein
MHVLELIDSGFIQICAPVKSKILTKRLVNNGGMYFCLAFKKKAFSFYIESWCNSHMDYGMVLDSFSTICSPFLAAKEIEIDGVLVRSNCFRELRVSENMIWRTSYSITRSGGRTIANIEGFYVKDDRLYHFNFIDEAIENIALDTCLSMLKSIQFKV